METALEQLINSPLPHRFVTAFITAVKEGGAPGFGPVYVVSIDISGCLAPDR